MFGKKIIIILVVANTKQKNNIFFGESCAPHFALLNHLLTVHEFSLQAQKIWILSPAKFKKLQKSKDFFTNFEKLKKQGFHSFLQTLKPKKSIYISLQTLRR